MILHASIHGKSRLYQRPRINGDIGLRAFGSICTGIATNNDITIAVNSNNQSSVFTRPVVYQAGNSPVHIGATSTKKEPRPGIGMNTIRGVYRTHDDRHGKV